MADRLPTPTPFTRMPPVVPKTRRPRRDIAGDILFGIVAIPAVVVLQLGPAFLLMGVAIAILSS